MKRFFLLLIVLLNIAFYASADSLNYLWEIPLNHPLEEAVVSFIEKTGIDLSPTKCINLNKESYIARDIAILNHSFDITLTGTKDSDSIPIFDSILIESVYFEETLDYDKFLGLIEGLRDMLEDSFGSPTNSGILIKADKGRFNAYEIPEAENHIDRNAIEMMVSDHGVIQIEYDWINIRLNGVLDSSGLIGIDIREETDTRARLDFNFVEQKGEYPFQVIKSF